MPLPAPRGRTTALFLGRSNPFMYDAGVIDGTSFPAGKSFRVCIGTDDVDFTVLKVKTDEADTILRALDGVGRGVQVEVEYDRGTSDRMGRLYSLKVLQAAAK